MKLYHDLIEVLCKKSKNFAEFYTQFEAFMPEKILEHAAANNEYYYKSNKFEFRSQYDEDDRFFMMATDLCNDASFMLEINAGYINPYDIIEKNYGLDIAGFVKDEGGNKTIYKISKTPLSINSKTDKVVLEATKEVYDYAYHLCPKSICGFLTYADIDKVKQGLI